MEKVSIVYRITFLLFKYIYIDINILICIYKLQNHSSIEVQGSIKFLDIVKRFVSSCCSLIWQRAPTCHNVLVQL